MKLSYAFIFTTLLVINSQASFAGPITDSFATGDTLTADHLNNAKAAVNDNDARINALVGHDHTSFNNLTINSSFTARGSADLRITAGDAATVDCTGEDGLLFYDTAHASLFVCAGGGVNIVGGRAFSLGSLPTSPGLDCQQILTAGATSSGFYWIDPDAAGAGTAFQVYCDMDTEGGGWTRFNWTRSILPPTGIDPLGQLLSDCRPTDANCFGRIPASASLTSLMIKNVTRSDYAAWDFDSSNSTSNAVLGALQSKATTAFINGAAWQPTSSNTAINYCGNPGGATCTGTCNSFYYNDTATWGMFLDDDAGFCCGAFKLGRSNAPRNDDRGYLSPGCATVDAFGEWYYR